jgi:lipooligosaccharide transport system permease protein
MLPMFLFATTFYPLTIYPRPIQVLVEILPLYHAIEFIRTPFLGPPTTAMLVAALYLAALGIAALLLAIHRMGGTLRR